MRLDPEEHQERAQRAAIAAYELADTLARGGDMPAAIRVGMIGEALQDEAFAATPAMLDAIFARWTGEGRAHA